MKKLKMLPDMIILDELNSIRPTMSEELTDKMMKDFDEAKRMYEIAMKGEYSFTRNRLV